ncbi:hypothetical protein OGAPHI_000779 [Ogataea philodendri]|uniref:Uncharacterized protein n=1 Tax=Ogataea philodendri TaxID=1378263 RepID=A0A9P8PF00_9ASCO|nr:uncharacterized protein OGAPHI_000779 [Ogataea philodendri]KAH3671068.1 hypothetical protein OGAPHI_000779 [Ogataea philodendri]
MTELAIEEPLEFDKVLQAVRDGAQDCLETRDFISYATILDIYLADPSSFKEDEKDILLEELSKVLHNDHELVYEIGWDLPAMLLRFFEGPLSNGFRLVDVKGVVFMMQIFEALATFGNPKELLLSTCELISEMKVEEDVERAKKFKENSQTTTYSRRRPESIFLIKVHLVLELVNTCLRRNVTVHPSKFLGMVVSALINFSKSSTENMTHLSVIRRFYTLVRDYIPPNIPESSDIPLEDLERLVDEENYLQRKLLLLVFSVMVETSTKGLGPLFLANSFAQMSCSASLEAGDKFEFIERFVSLAMSLDLELDNMFDAEVAHAGKVFEGRNITDTEQIFKLAVDNYNSSEFRQKTPQEIPFSPTAVTILYAYSRLVQGHKYTKPLPNFLSLVKLQLCVLIPYVIDGQLLNDSAIVSLVLLTMKSLERGIDKYTETDKLLIFAYLQNLASLCLESEDSNLRRFLYSLTTKVFVSLQEQDSYEYIVDSLEHCSAESYRICMIGILKDLMLRNRQGALEDELEKLQVSAPALPPRQLTYIQFTPAREQRVLELLDKAVAETFAEDVDPVVCNSLLAYMNLILSIKKFDAKQVHRRVATIQRRISKLDKSHQQIVDLIQFSIDKASEFYKE